MSPRKQQFLFLRCDCGQQWEEPIATAFRNGSGSLLSGIRCECGADLHSIHLARPPEQRRQAA